MKIEVPDRLGKWLYREPLAWGSRNGPPKGRGRPAKRVFIENLTAASVRECPLPAKRDPRRTSIVSCGRSRRGRRNGTKSSFPESSRRALQVALNRRIQIDGARAARVLARKAAQRDDSSTKGRAMIPTTPARGGVSKDTRRTAAKSKDRRSSPGGLAETPGVLRRRQERADDTRGGRGPDRVVRPSPPALPVSRAPSLWLVPLLPPER
ncbi:hypothetical protein THAOC_26592, partial [Thalassiosira oceanica]